MLSTGEIVGTAVGATFGAYILAVIVLYRCPTLLHRRKPYLFDGYLIAHRGGAGENLENTMGAFRHAVENAKTDILELDLHLTKDKQVVICHDGDLSRVTGRKVVIEETDYADLPCLNQHLDVTFDPGNRVERTCEDDQIPLFEDLLKALPDTVVNIDMKHGTQELVTATAKLLQKYNRTQSVIWGSSTNAVHTMARNEDPTILRYFDIKGGLRLSILFWTGILAFLPIEEHVLELPYIPARVSERLFNGAGAGVRFVVKFVAGYTRTLLLNRFLIAYLQRRGIQTYAFVLNEEEDWHDMYKRGVTGIHTDYPTKLRRFLDANPQYTQHKESPRRCGERSSLMTAATSQPNKAGEDL